MLNINLSYILSPLSQFEVNSLIGLELPILGNFYISKAKFKSDLAKGLTYGNASHAFGTAKALESNIEAGAFSTIGMILTAVLSAIMLPVLYLMTTYI